MGRPKNPERPLLSVLIVDHLPRDVKESLEQMAAKGSSVEQLQRHAKKNFYLVSRKALRTWLADLPLKKAASVYDLPEALQQKVASWWLTRRDYASCVNDLADAGYRANIQTLRKWYKEILRSETLAESSGEFDPSKSSISKELEAWGLTGVLDMAVDALVRNEKRPELKTTGDLARLSDVIIRVVNANVARRKLELEEGQLMAKARTEFDQKIRRLLAGYPELAKQLQEIADEVEEDAKLMAQ